MMKRLTAAITAFLPALVAAAVVLAAERTPTAVIEALHQVVLDTFKQSDRLDAPARFERLAPVVSATYDFPRMLGIIAGPAWTAADEAERAALTEAFRRFSIANYAARFKGYTGERFEILGERPGLRDLVIVETRLVRTDGPPVAINYVFERRDGGWLAIDVIAERAISELALRRSEYAQTLKEGGLAGLTALLNERTAEMLAE